MWHPFPGFSGLLTSCGIGLALWLTLHRMNSKVVAYNLGPGGDPQAYEPILLRYIRFAEFMIGLATGSIVLIVGSSAIHGQGGKLPWFYAPPLLLVANSVIFGLAFMASQLVTMENGLHGNPHTTASYTLNETLGYSSLVCFVCGYFWLVIAVTNMG